MAINLTDLIASNYPQFTGGTVANAITITSSTQATSTTTGALIVTGGVGIGKDLHAGNIYSNTVKLTNPEVFTFGGTGTPVTGTAMTPYVRVTTTQTSVSASLVTKTAPSFCNQTSTY
jgi:hypothetical protein